MTSPLSKTGDTGTRSWFGADPIAALRSDFDDLLGRFGFASGGNLAKAGAFPALDLSETEGTVDVHMDLPGVDPKNIDIEIRGNLLTISGSTSEEKEEKNRSYHRVERRQGTFSRTVTLPCEVVESKANASYKDGVLTLSIPKTEPAKTHKVAVTTTG